MGKGVGGEGVTRGEGATELLHTRACIRCASSASHVKFRPTKSVHTQSCIRAFLFILLPVRNLVLDKDTDEGENRRNLFDNGGLRTDRTGSGDACSSWREIGSGRRLEAGGGEGDLKSEKVEVRSMASRFK